MSLFKKILLSIGLTISLLLFLLFPQISTAEEPQSGKVWQWESDTLTPTIKEGLNDVIAVSVGLDHSLALKNDGTVWAWGSNTRGQLGNGLNSGSIMIPTQVKSSDGQEYLTDIKAIAAGRWHSMALKNDGTVWVWGINGNGGLGTGIGNNDNFSILTLPTQVKGETSNAYLTDIVEMAAGHNHRLALKSDGRVFAWGTNNHGQIGNGCFLGNCSLILRPTEVLNDAVSIAAACCHSLAVKNDGSVWGWGRPIEGQLGSFTNGESQQPFPIQITGLSEIREVVAKEFYSLARSHNNTVLEWGGGRWGDPRQVTGLVDVKAVTAGRSSLLGGIGLALKNDGTVWQWNRDDIIPHQVPGLSSIISISGGTATPNLAVISSNLSPKTPLILIPGMAGSELKTAEPVNWSQPNNHGGTFTNSYPPGELIWLNIFEALKPGNDDYFDILRMNTDGKMSQANLGLTGNLLRQAYQGMIDFFTSNGYTLGQDLFLFPYDWRMDIATTESDLDQIINGIIDATGAEKVDIVSHSMGGLVARNYIDNSDNAQKVRKLFTLGTPHLGATEFIKNLMYGGCMSIDFLKKPICFGVSPGEIKDIVQNMISGFELSPSQAYFDFYTGNDKLYPFPFRDVIDIDSDGVTGELNYSEIKTLLSNLGHNTDLFNPAEIFHTLDQDLRETNGVDIRVIAGSGIGTLGQIIEKERITRGGGRAPMRDKIVINGDGTVPLYSASILDPLKPLSSLLGPAELYYTNQKHGDMVKDGPALNLVKNILDDDLSLPSDVQLDPYKLKGSLLSVHSPVEIHVYQNGNHTGPTENGDSEAGIPGSSYDKLEDSKFVWLPDEGIYDIKFDSTGEGSFDFKIRKFEEDLNSHTFLYHNVPLTTSATGSAVFDTQFPEPPILNLYTNGDGNEDFQVAHFSILDEDASYDNTPPILSVNPQTIWPPNGKMVDVTIDTIDENPYLTTISVEDEYGLVEPSVATDHGETSQTIQLEASRRDDDKDGRKYTIKVFSTDLAGNSSLESFEVLVPHDQR